MIHAPTRNYHFRAVTAATRTSFIIEAQAAHEAEFEAKRHTVRWLNDQGASPMDLTDFSLLKVSH